MNQLADTACAPAFWRFAAPVFAGSVGAKSLAWVGRQIAADRPERTQAAAAAVAGLVGFWLVAGVTWIALNHRE